MKSSTRWLVAALTALAFVLSAGAAAAQAVTQVLIVEVEPQQMEQYMGFVKRAQGLFEKMGVSPIQVTQATLAGSDTGSIAILIEAESLAALAARQQKVSASKDWQKFVADITKADISRIVTNSVWSDITPK